MPSSDVAVVSVRAESCADDATDPAGMTACLPPFPASLFHPFIMDALSMVPEGGARADRANQPQSTQGGVEPQAAKGPVLSHPLLHTCARRTGRVFTGDQGRHSARHAPHTTWHRYHGCGRAPCGHLAAPRPPHARSDRRVRLPAAHTRS